MQQLCCFTRMFKLVFLPLPSYWLRELSETTSWFQVWFNSEALGRQGEEVEEWGAGQTGKSKSEKVTVYRRQCQYLSPNNASAEPTAVRKGSNLMICSIFKPKVGPSFISEVYLMYLVNANQLTCCNRLNSGLKVSQSSFPGRWLC